MGELLRISIPANIGSYLTGFCLVIQAVDALLMIIGCTVPYDDICAAKIVLELWCFFGALSVISAAGGISSDSVYCLNNDVCLQIRPNCR